MIQNLLLLLCAVEFNIDLQMAYNKIDKPYPSPNSITYLIYWYEHRKF